MSVVAISGIAFASICVAAILSMFLRPLLPDRYLSIESKEVVRLGAALIATGVVIPLGLEAASLTNFAGYVLWCLWLLAMAAFLWRTPATATTPAATVTGANPLPGR